LLIIQYKLIYLRVQVVKSLMISEISVKNFKSIQNETIKLKGINFIIGANNAGKSNLLDALEFYQRMLVMELQEVFGPVPFSFRNALHRGANIRSDCIEIGINYRNNQSIIHNFSVESIYNNGQGPRFLLRVKNETLKIGDVIENNSKSPNLLLRKKFLTYALQPDVSDYVKNCRTIRKFQFVPKDIKKEQIIDYQLEQIPYLQPNGANLVNVLYTIRDTEPKAFDNIMKDFREIFPDVASLSFKHLGESRYALEFTRTVEGTEWKFLSPEISDGFVITLAIITLINTPNRLKIILIEEIENGLNPSTLRIILERIMKATEISNIQFIITTHSPILLELLNQNPEYIIICEQDKGKSKYIPLQEILTKFGKDYKPEESLFQLWFNGLIGGL